MDSFSTLHIHFHLNLSSSFLPISHLIYSIYQEQKANSQFSKYKNSKEEIQGRVPFLGMIVRFLNNCELRKIYYKHPLKIQQYFNEIAMYYSINAAMCKEQYIYIDDTAYEVHRQHLKFMWISSHLSGNHWMAVGQDLGISKCWGRTLSLIYVPLKEKQDRLMKTQPEGPTAPTSTWK